MEFKWDINGKGKESSIIRTREAFEWVKANLPVSDRIHKIEFSDDPAPRAVVHQYPGNGVHKENRYRPMEPPLEVTLCELPPEELRP